MALCGAMHHAAKCTLFHEKARATVNKHTRRVHLIPDSDLSAVAGASSRIPGRVPTAGS